MQYPILLSVFTYGFACDSMLFRANFKEEESADFYQATEIAEPPSEQEELLILNYNIKYGGARLKFFWECLKFFLITIL